MHTQKMSDYVAASQVAVMLGVSVETLRHWRYAGKHLDLLPPYAFVNRRIFYKRTDVERFVEASMTPRH